MDVYEYAFILLHAVAVSLLVGYLGGAWFESQSGHLTSRDPSLSSVQSTQANAAIVPRLNHDY